MSVDTAEHLRRNPEDSAIEIMNFLLKNVEFDTILTAGFTTLVKLDRVELDWLRHEFRELEHAIQEYQRIGKSSPEHNVISRDDFEN